MNEYNIWKILIIDAIQGLLILEFDPEKVEIVQEYIGTSISKTFDKSNFKTFLKNFKIDKNGKVSIIDGIGNIFKFSLFL